MCVANQNWLNFLRFTLCVKLEKQLEWLSSRNDTVLVRKMCYALYVLLKGLKISLNLHRNDISVFEN